MVLNTYAARGPSGSARRPSTSGRSAGEGKAWVQTSSSSATPMLRMAAPASTGNSRPAATACSRSPIRSVGAISSPPR